MSIENERFKSIREALSLTQETFAEQLNISTASVRKLEKDGNLGVSHAIRIHELYGYSLDYIYGLTDNTHDAASDMLLYLKELFDIEFNSEEIPFTTLYVKESAVVFLRGYAQAKALLDNGTIPQAAFDPWLSKLKKDYDTASDKEEPLVKYGLVPEDTIREFVKPTSGTIRVDLSAPLS